MDRLIEDEAAGLNSSERVRRYLALGEKWSAGHKHRMIEAPATAAGLDTLEELARMFLYVGHLPHEQKADGLIEILGRPGE